MVDALKANAASTADNRKKRTFKVSRFQLPLSDVVEVSGIESEEGPDKEVFDDVKQRSKNKSDRKKTKGVLKSSASKKADETKGKGKRKRKISKMVPEIAAQGPLHR